MAGDRGNAFCRNSLDLRSVSGFLIARVADHHAFYVQRM
jgi:hypothetical protein